MISLLMANPSLAAAYLSEGLVTPRFTKNAASLQTATLL